MTTVLARITDKANTVEQLAEATQLRQSTIYGLLRTAAAINLVRPIISTEKP